MKAITILKSVSTWVKNKSAKLKGVKIMNTLNFVTARFKKASFFRAGVRELMASVFVAGAVVFVFVFGSASFAADSVAKGETEAQVKTPVLERIGGNFTIVKIYSLRDGGFGVDFKASEGSPKIMRLHLESDHINAGLIEGQALRLSADVLAHKGDLAEISQVVVFMSGPAGPTPAWMISKKATGLTPPVRLIEMHAPSTDYAIF